MPDQSSEHDELPIPVWDSIKNSCLRWGPGRTTLIDIIGQGLVDTRKLGTKVLVRQQGPRSIGAYVESLPTAKINLTARRRRQLAKIQQSENEEGADGVMTRGADLIPANQKRNEPDGTESRRTRGTTQEAPHRR
jgi:hypothetical protein